VTRDYRGNAVCVDVIDSGKGVQENQVEHLFEPFFTTRPEGTGLGLYLSRELCEANRATLSYGRTVEGCTRFRMNIPLREPLS
jgi:two-component system sensor histidine kinase PilS (NtrC family)